MDIKKVLILGLGLNEGGVGSARYFAKKGCDVLVTDVKTEDELKPSLEKLKEFDGIKYHLGGHKNEDIDWADLIIKNQAIKPSNPYLVYAREKGKDIKTDVGIFLKSVNPKNIIGVTGTKGKSTTASLIYEVLKNADRKVILSGNIGKSVLDSIEIVTDDMLIVLEISSFQLESFDAIKISPKYSVITNIYPDHLNYYLNFEEYIAAKKLIAAHQTENDFLFINKEDKITNSKEFLGGVKSEIIFYSSEDLPGDFEPLLAGKYNLSNLAAAYAVSKVLKIDDKAALKTLADFQGVEFRLQLIKEWNGVKIYNNTTATAPEPAIESLKTFPNCILIAGGMNKGLDYKEFSEAIDTFAKDVYFLDGDATSEIINNLRNNASSVSKHHTPYQNFFDILQTIKLNLQQGDTVLFSPGATSFNLFQNEFDRGRKFNEAVEKVFAEEAVFKDKS